MAYRPGIFTDLKRLAASSFLGTFLTKQGRDVATKNLFKMARYIKVTIQRDLLEIYIIHYDGMQ